MQYIVLPVLLSLIGFTGALSSAISLLLSLVTAGIILYNMVELWPTGWRWRYMGIGAVMLFVLGVFLVDDLRMLWNGR